jgi:uncharacterized membrane protein YfcA
MKRSNSAPSAHSIVETPELATQRFRYFTPWLLILTGLWLVIYVACFPHPAELAARNWPLILMGLAGAVVGNFTSIGGGLVFIPVLMFAYDLNPVSALKVALVAQAVGMTSGACGWYRRGVVPSRLLSWTIPGLVVGSIISSFFIRPSPMMVKAVFSPICIVAGILILVTQNRKNGRLDFPRSGNWPLALISTFGGLITGWVAIGEGEIVAAFCMLVYALETNRAIGLGVVLLSINSILLAGFHTLIFGGVSWDIAIFTMLGVLWGGRLGPFLAQNFPAKILKRTFAIIAILDGLLVFFQAVGLLTRLKDG